MQVSEEEARFCQVTWEILNIMKENFPSKINLYQENLSLSGCHPASLQEELRRQISCLVSLKEENRLLTTDEYEEVWSALQFAEKLNDHRAMGICLEIVNTQMQRFNVHLIREKNGLLDETVLWRIITREEVGYLETNRIIAQEIIKTAQDAARVCDQGVQMEIQSLQSSQSSIAKQSSDKNTSTRMCLFQLSESNDINRVTQILQTLSSKSKETMQQMRKKYNLGHKLVAILRKYCNADYGFEQVTSKNGQFQYYLIKMMIILAGDYAVFLEFLQSQALDLLCQLVEEGVIYAYESAKQGCPKEDSYLFRFLRLALDLLDLTFSKNFTEFLPIVKDNLTKIEARLFKVIQKQEKNPLLQFFQEDQQEMKEEPKTAITYCQLTLLRGLSPGLYKFAVDLSQKVQRVQGLNDTLFENHETKYQRMFPLLVQRIHVNSKPHVDQQQPTKFESLPTFSGYQDPGVSGQDITGEEFDIDDTRDNQENLSTNVYLKNKIEQGFKRVISQNHQATQLKPRSTNEQLDAQRIDGARKADFKSQQLGSRSKYD